ncbi:hypothetical protein GCM10027567_30380 [Spongiibacter taiwanensis]
MTLALLPPLDNRNARKRPLERFAVRKPKDQLAQLTEHFRDLHRLMLADHASPEALFSDYLATGLRAFSMSTGLLVCLEDDTATIIDCLPANTQLQPNDQILIADTPLEPLVSAQATMAVPDAGRNALRFTLSSPEAKALLVAPIWTEGRLYGAICFTDTQPRDTPFPEGDTELIELMAKALGRNIERNHLEERRRQAMQMVRENMELFESAFQHAAIGMALVSPTGRWLRVNQSLCDIVGYSTAELLETDFQTITYPDDLQKDLDLLTEALDGKRDTYRIEKRYIRKDESLVWVQLNVSVVRDRSGSPRYLLSQIQDITTQKEAINALNQRGNELEAANRHLQDIAMTDPLTLVRNRRAFDVELERLVAEATASNGHLSLLLVDVDHFKAYNDALGHPAGDAALKAVSNALLGGARAKDVVARYGGEEFAIILPHTDAEACRHVAERLRRNIENISALPSAITASIGSATQNPHRHGDELPPRNLLKRADLALYAAKEAGRNLSLHFDDLDTESSQTTHRQQQAT